MNNQRILLAGVLGAVAMYLWTFIAHMFLPLGEAGIRQIENEQPLLTQMSATLNEHGIYLFPRMAPGTSEAQYQKLVETGPSGLMVYFPKRQFAFGQSLAVEFLTELVQALIAAWLLSLTRVRTFAGRVGFYAALGILAAISTNLSYWNWYGFPTLYTASYSLTGWTGYLCAGLVAAAMKLGGGTTATVPA
jgi:hypothetical protein